MRARREKKLCYNCDEAFVPGHNCKVRYSYVLMNEDEVKAYEEDCIIACNVLKHREWDIEDQRTDKWKGRTITVTHKGREVVLRALTGKTKLRTFMAEPLSELLGRRRTYRVVNQLFSVHSNCNQEVENPLIMKLLQRFEDVFQEPQSLPPERSIEHRNDLMPDAIPRRQPPYRYAYG
ncbi:UNVERIFIED_CONTAM: hypothetical protein Sindi_0465800 [Sesamum indicum]